MLRIESAFNVVEGVVSSSLSVSHRSISSSVNVGCFAMKVFANVVKLSYSPKQTLMTESDDNRPPTMSGSTDGLKPIPVASLAPSRHDTEFKYFKAWDHVEKCVKMLSILTKGVHVYSKVRNSGQGATWKCVLQ